MVTNWSEDSNWGSAQISGRILSNKLTLKLPTFDTTTNTIHLSKNKVTSNRDNTPLYIARGTNNRRKPNSDRNLIPETEIWNQLKSQNPTCGRLASYSGRPNILCSLLGLVGTANSDFLTSGWSTERSTSTSSFSTVHDCAHEVNHSIDCLLSLRYCGRPPCSLFSIRKLYNQAFTSDLLP